MIDFISLDILQLMGVTSEVLSMWSLNNGLGQFIHVKFQGRVEKKCLYIFPRLVGRSGPITTDYVDGLGSVISIQNS